MATAVFVAVDAAAAGFASVGLWSQAMHMYAQGRRQFVQCVTDGSCPVSEISACPQDGQLDTCCGEDTDSLVWRSRGSWVGGQGLPETVTRDQFVPALCQAVLQRPVSWTMRPSHVAHDPTQIGSLSSRGSGSHVVLGSTQRTCSKQWQSSQNGDNRDGKPERRKFQDSWRNYASVAWGAH